MILDWQNEMSVFLYFLKGRRPEKRIALIAGEEGEKSEIFYGFWKVYFCFYYFETFMKQTKVDKRRNWSLD